MLISISYEPYWALRKRITAKKNPDMKSYFENVDISIEEFTKLLDTTMLYTHQHDCDLCAKPTSLHLEKDTAFASSFFRLEFETADRAKKALSSDFVKKYASFITYRAFCEDKNESCRNGIVIFFEPEEVINDIAMYSKISFSLNDKFSFARGDCCPTRIYYASEGKSEILGNKLPMDVIYELIDEHYMFYYENLKYYFPSAVTEYEKRVHSFRVKEGVRGFCNE